MTIDITEIRGVRIAEIISDTIEINNPQDALDIMGNCSYQNAWSIIIHQKNIAASFFDLKTGIAGEILQKFSTYNYKLAIIGDFSKFQSKSLRDFIYESNKRGSVLLLNDIDEAKKKLIKNE